MEACSASGAVSGEEAKKASLGSTECTCPCFKKSYSIAMRNGARLLFDKPCRLVKQARQLMLSLLSMSGFGSESKTRTDACAVT